MKKQLSLFPLVLSIAHLLQSSTAKAMTPAVEKAKQRRRVLKAKTIPSTKSRRNQQSNQQKNQRHHQLLQDRPQVRSHLLLVMRLHL